MILSPALTESGTTLPLLRVLPEPTAITLPSWGFSCAESGRYNPLLVFSTEPSRWTMTRSPIGFSFKLEDVAVAVAIFSPPSRAAGCYVVPVHRTPFTVHGL